MFFCRGSGGDACYSLKCLESVPFPLQSVSFRLSTAGVFTWSPEGKICTRVSPGLSSAKVGGGVTEALVDAHMGYMWSFKDIAG